MKPSSGVNRIALSSPEPSRLIGPKHRIDALPQNFCRKTFGVKRSERDTRMHHRHPKTGVCCAKHRQSVAGHRAVSEGYLIRMKVYAREQSLKPQERCGDDGLRVLWRGFGRVRLMMRRQRAIRRPEPSCRISCPGIARICRISGATGRVRRISPGRCSIGNGWPTPASNSAAPVPAATIT